MSHHPPLSISVAWMTLLLLFTLNAHLIHGQDRAVGLMRHDPGTFEGYTLFMPIFGPHTFLIDNDGSLVHQWTSDFQQSIVAYLLENGHLLRAASSGENPVLESGGQGGRIEEFDWEGNLVWHFELNADTSRLHHDYEPLPNGNILMIAWEFRSTNEAHMAGRDTTGFGLTGMWPLRIIEVEPADSAGGSIVWEWRVWDHLIQEFDSTKANFGPVAEHPELIDVNWTGRGGDFVHTNAIDYNPDLDQIAVSTPIFNEIWIIDHSTTTEEAASHEGGNSGHGGDLLYRWGNPATYGAGSAGDQRLFFQHDVQWVPPGYPGEGNLTIFNNGNGRPEGPFSSILEIDPAEDGAGGYVLEPGTAYEPEDPVWMYVSPDPEDFYSPIISGVHRLPNGNTFVTSGVQGTLFEVTPGGTVVWEYVNPVSTAGPIPVNMDPDTLDNRMFRATRYPADYAAFAGRDLTPMGPIELPAVAVEHDLPDSGEPLLLLGNYPNPTSAATSIRFRLPEASDVTVKLYDELGRLVKVIADQRWYRAGLGTVRLEAANLAPGVYFYSVDSDGGSATGRVLVTR